MCRHSVPRVSDQVRPPHTNQGKCSANLHITLPLFVRRECPSSTHASINRMKDAACGYAEPSPPNPPFPPPRPPSPPPPPLASAGTLRVADAETASDPDCLPVSYTACLEATQRMHTSNSRISPNIAVSQAACEGTEAETSSCFIGCALGNELGVPALFTFQRAIVASEFAWFMSYRCIDNNEHPQCLCATPLPPPPPVYDPVDALAKDYVYAGNPVSGTISYQPSGFYKAVAIDSKLPGEFVASTHVVDCRGSDSGASSCTRMCATDFLGRLKAFHITATPLPPSPPPPGIPPLPPRPPPSPNPPLSEFRFSGATEGCRANGYRRDECRDGGVGSIWPPLCDYGSSVSLCGHREDVGRGAVIGDDSCTTANNGQCEDGAEGTSYFATDSLGQQVAVCRYATEYAETVSRTVTPPTHIT